MNEELLRCDADFYLTVCILKRLLEMGMITDDEYGKIGRISRDHYGARFRAF